MKTILAALLDFIRSIDFASIISGVIAGIGGFWGKLLALIAKPVLSSVEQKIDQQIGQYENEQKSDSEIDQAAKDHVDQIQKAKTDDEVDQAFRDSIR